MGVLKDKWSMIPIRRMKRTKTIVYRINFLSLIHLFLIFYSFRMRIIFFFLIINRASEQMGIFCSPRGCGGARSGVCVWLSCVNGGGGVKCETGVLFQEDVRSSGVNFTGEGRARNRDININVCQNRTTLQPHSRVLTNSE